MVEQMDRDNRPEKGLAEKKKMIAGILEEKSRIILATHVNPDGDALGSLLGLASILESKGKEVFRFLEEPVSPLYQFLPGVDKVQTSVHELKSFAAVAPTETAAVALDCGDSRRLGDLADELLKITPFLVIDHHLSNNGFGTVSWVDPRSSSTGEMVFDLAQELRGTLTVDIAQCLYTAILTDTGSFRYETTSAHTFAVAGELVGLGVRPEQVATRVFDNYSPQRLRLLELVLSTLELYANDRIAFIHVSRIMYEKTGTTQDDTEGFINFPRSITSVEVAVFLKEIEDGRVSVSLRAKGGCDVAAIAARFGGGGHRNAAGFRKKGTLESVHSMLLPAIEKALATGEGSR